MNVFEMGWGWSTVDLIARRVDLTNFAFGVTGPPGPTRLLHSFQLLISGEWALIASSLWNHHFPGPLAAFVEPDH